MNKLGLIEKTLNKVEVEQLFEDESILFGDTNGVPYYRVVELFGEMAAVFIEKNQKYDGYLKPGADYNSWGDCTISYLYRTGFMKVATEHNISIAKQRHFNSPGGQLIDKYFEERYRRMEEQDEADGKKAEERKAKRATSRANKQQLTP